jgi:uncharacterized protein YjbI with pentapeptide repeats
VTAPSQQELDALPPDRRLELLELEQQRLDQERERRRQSLNQRFNTIGIVVGFLFTALGLGATAFTLYNGQQELRTAREGQITDRYTKAVEQLGSTKRDVRTAAVYALERIATDSPRDRTTIRDVLAAFTREHDPTPGTEDDKLPVEPDTDVHAALTVLARRPTDPTNAPPLDLHAIRVPGANLSTIHTNKTGIVVLYRANFSDADLSHADLTDADLTSTDLTDGDLRYANLTGADLTDADLSHANLNGATLRHAQLPGVDLSYQSMSAMDLSATELTEANLSHANLSDAVLAEAYLRSADLTGADLNSANLSHANLTGANLTGATLLGAHLAGVRMAGVHLTGADLRGADLTGVNLTGVDLSRDDLGGANLSKVIWSPRYTRWPENMGSTEEILDRSEPMKFGLYRLHLGVHGR